MYVLLRALGVALLLVVVSACGGGSAQEPPAEEEPPFQPPAGPDVRINTDAAGDELSVFPEICGAGEKVYIVWYDRRSGLTDIHFNRSLDGGASWLATDRRLDTDPPGSAGSNVPRLCCHGDVVHVAWSDQRGVRSQIRYNRSVDAGATWLASDVRLDLQGAEDFSSWNVDLCCSGDAVYVVWQDARNGLGDIYLRTSHDGGVTWSPTETRLDTDAPGDGHSEFPRIACSGDAVYVVWQDDRDGEPDVRFNRSLDRGTLWGAADLRLDTDEAGAAASVGPVVCCDGARVYAVWADGRDGERDIRANASDDGGTAFLAEDRRLDTDLAGDAASLVPAVCCSGASVYVTWEDFRFGSSDVYFSRSTDGGVTWRALDVRLDTDPPGIHASFLPRIARGSGGRLYVVWYDNRRGAFDVLLSSSSDDGDTWLETEIRLDTDEEGAAHSMAPCLLVEGEQARSAWYDQRAGPGDIHFNRAEAP